MKANYIKLKTPIEQAYHIRKDIRAAFNDHWHFHEMLELVVILKGNGKRYIGDSIENFSKGDVILVGKKLPHVWRSFEDGALKTSQCKCESIIIQFPKNFIGDAFINLPESKNIKALFNSAQVGISFQNETRKTLANKIKSLLKYNGMERLLKLLEVLNIASNTKEFKLLASPLFKETILNNDYKINKVFEFVMDNFTNTITLDEAAKTVFMNKTSFCRYFKNHTKKTFSEFVNEIRIGYACKLIQENKYSISEAAYLSGYNSPSHFNKQFNLIKKVSPSAFYQNSKEM